MLNKNWILVGLSLFFVGCASVPKANLELSQQAKQLNAPSAGNAGIYLYRSNALFGTALKKDLWIDGKCIGETSRGVFFYKEVLGDQEHTVSTESEFSANNLVLKTASGKKYFIQQYLKMGAFVAGANLELIDEETGSKAIQDYELGEQGHCGSLTLK